MKTLKSTILVLMVLIICPRTYCQSTNVYSKGVTAQGNITEIANMSPYGVGGMGFDERYEGVKGSPRLYDTLYPSLMKVKTQNFHILVDSDIDVAGNKLVFKHPSTGQLMSIPSEIIEEVIISTKDGDHVIRTTSGMEFEKPVGELRFCQILYDGNYQFIKLPVKIFKEADYKNLYSSDRRYDEFETDYRYYITGKRDQLIQVKLNKKNLEKLFPARKDLINEIIKHGDFSNDEEMVVALLKRL
jgi:hypothetical protein